MSNTRKYWEGRAKALNDLYCRSNVRTWTVGRTDTRSFVDGEYVHYAYPPETWKDRVMFRGTPVQALKDAVLYAEKKNENLKRLTAKQTAKGGGK